MENHAPALLSSSPPLLFTTFDEWREKIDGRKINKSKGVKRKKLKNSQKTEECRRANCFI
jgi:hypothetical protein